MKYFFGRLNVIIIYTWDKRSATNYGPKTTRRNAIWRCTNAYETRARASHPRRSPSIRYCPELNSIDCMFEFVYLWLCLVSMALTFAIHLGRIHVMLVQARARDFEWERDGGGRLCRNEMRSESHSLTHTHTLYSGAGPNDGRFHACYENKIGDCAQNESCVLIGLRAIARYAHGDSSVNQSMYIFHSSTTHIHIKYDVCNCLDFDFDSKRCFLCETFFFFFFFFVRPTIESSCLWARAQWAI